MSQYGEIYRSEFKSFQGEVIRIDISPTDNLIDDADTPIITPMQPSATPLVISTVDNDEDKFTPIKAKQAEIRVKTDSLINLGLFSAGPDNLWYVKITNQATADVLFYGFLVLDDIGQPFLSNPQELTLIASDHLGILKDVPLTNFDGNYPVGYFRIADFIAWALFKTGLSLPIRVINNLRVGLGAFSFSAQFSADLNRIALPSAAAAYFYPGMQFTTSSTNNPGPFTVAAVAGGIISLVQLNETVVNEGPVTITFTDSNSGKHFYDAVSLWAQTFEKEISEAEDCYTVLKKILGEDCTIFQYKGEWWIVRIDEYEGNPFYAATFNADGTFASFDGVVSLDQSVSPTDINRFVGADAFLRTTRPLGFSRETYKYQYPQEIVCNITFDRGDLIDGSNPYQKTYQVDCLDKLKKASAPDDLVAATATIVTRRTFDPPDYEKDRYVVIGADSDPENLIRSNKIFINNLDKISINLTRALSSDVTGSGPYTDVIGQIRLYADDGTFWTLHGGTITDDVVRWEQTDSIFSTNQKFLQIQGDISDDLSQAVSKSVDEVAVPRSGYIQILLYQTSLWGAGGIFGPGRDTYIYPPSFTLTPYIANSYTRFTGNELKVSRTDTGYLANRDEEVFISDAPSRLFKGALLLDRGDTVVLVNKFYAAAPFALGNPPGPDYVHPYGYIQAYSVWNQGRNGLSKISGNILWNAGAFPDLINRFTLSDPNDNTNNRYFIVLSMQQDWKRCVMNCTVCEVYNTVTGKVYSDPFTFKYITT